MIKWYKVNTLPNIVIKKNNLKKIRDSILLVSLANLIIGLLILKLLTRKIIIKIIIIIKTKILIILGLNNLHKKLIKRISIILKVSEDSQILVKTKQAPNNNKNKINKDQKKILILEVALEIFLNLVISNSPNKRIQTANKQKKYLKIISNSK